MEHPLAMDPEAMRQAGYTTVGALPGRVLADVLAHASWTDHPGYLAFVPSFTTWPGRADYSGWPNSACVSWLFFPADRSDTLH